MTEYARAADGVVVELFTPPAGFQLSDCLHPDVAATFVPVPSGVTVAVGYSMTQSGGAWSFAAPAGPTLASVQASQSAAMRTACQQAIEAGFSSSATGAALTYPSDATSQTNIVLAAANGGQLWCENGTTWSFVAHTAAQASQVRADLATHVQAQQTIYANHLTEIAAATNVAAVEAIVWTGP